MDYCDEYQQTIKSLKTPAKIEARRFFLTYSRCPVSKEELSTHLLSLADNRYWLVCEEKHADGTPHLHAVVHYSKKVHTTNMRFFDYQGYHPHIRIPPLVGDFERCASYCRKDGNYIGNLEEKISKRTALAKRVIEHGTLDRSLLLDNPELLFLNFGSVQNWLSLLGPKRTRIEYPQQKKRHYWLYGPSNSGKTTLLREFIDEKISVEIPHNNDWHTDASVEVLYSDEFKGHLTVQQLNRLCDGHTNLNKKGGSSYIKFPIIVIVSNFSIIDCYKNVSTEMHETLFNRFIQYELPNQVPDW